MGHSLGGTITQLLLDRGLGAAGVGLASAAVKGVRDLPLSTLRSTRPVLGNPFNRGKATGLSAKQFHYAFGNTLSRADSDAIYKRYHVPAANRVLFETASPTSVATARLRSTSATTPGRRCCSSASRTTTSSRPR